MNYIGVWATTPEDRHRRAPATLHAFLVSWPFIFRHSQRFIKHHSVRTTFWSLLRDQQNREAAWITLRFPYIINIIVKKVDAEENEYDIGFTTHSMERSLTRMLTLISRLARQEAKYSSAPNHAHLLHSPRLLLLGVFSPRRFQNAEREDPRSSNAVPEQKNSCLTPDVEFTKDAKNERAQPAVTVE
ncbi:hypothetical protein F2P81_013701 [Scophthalmus maximus]|uniref:Uncharacterized protein n=1 Tax=Scophthalmus maximus TaxID=52904 RepID=A0A6A4SM85_SCOMX|nr:hypothetical protein F2P81_013701 [Scophthalmus maximus]